MTTRIEAIIDHPIIDLAIKISTPIIVAALFAVASILWSLNERVIRLEESRAAHSEKLSQLPPVWLREDIAELKTEVFNLRTEVADMRRSLPK